MKRTGNASGNIRLCFGDAVGEGVDLGAVDLGASEHTVRGSALGIVASAEPGADALFADELDGRQEEVLEQAEFVGVERGPLRVARRRRARGRSPLGVGPFSSRTACLRW